MLPASIDLAGAEIELVSVVARENRLLRALRAYLAEHPTDYVFIDCPPSLGLLTLNALVAATEILIPIQCEYYALEGVSQLMRTINLVNGELNQDLQLTTVVLTMFDARTRLAAQVAAGGADALRRGDAADGHPALGADQRGAQLRPDRADVPPRLRRSGVLPQGRAGDRPARRRHDPQENR